MAWSVFIPANSPRPRARSISPKFPPWGRGAKAPAGGKCPRWRQFLREITDEMPQHVGMDSERHLGGRPKPGQHPAKGNRRHRSAALAHEDISSGFLFALAAMPIAIFIDVQISGCIP